MTDTDTSPETTELVKAYCDTRLAYDVAHAISVKANSVHGKAKKALVKQMEKKSRQHDPPGVLKFHLSEVFTIACNEENEDDIKDWLEKQYGDIEEFCAQKVQKKAVVERIKNDIDDEKLNEFDIPDFMNLNSSNQLNCNGWKQYSAIQRNKS